MIIFAAIHLTIQRKMSANPIKVAVIAPLSGPDEAIGQAIKRGINLFVDDFNEKRNLAYPPIQLMLVDEASHTGSAEDLVQQAAREGAATVIGPWAQDMAERMETAYQTAQLPALTLAPPTEQHYPEQPWLFRAGFDSSFETRFLANYVRNVVGEKTVNIIYPEGPEGERMAALYDETMQRFGTKVLYKWGYDAHAPELAARVQDIAKEINEQKLIGYLLVLGDAVDSAGIVTGLRAGNVRNRIVGLRTLATAAFVGHAQRIWRGDASLSSVLNNILLVTPLLFDTAGEAAQQFNSAYRDAYGEAPDWVAAQAYDMARVLGQTLKALNIDEHMPLDEQRNKLRERLAGMDKTETALPGNQGAVVLNPTRNSLPSAFVGVYDGSDLISALTQLTPIAQETVVNYLQEIIEGRALYVNDRFMYKTNVVYTGVKVDKVTSLDLKANTAEIEFWLWFRWRGKVEPQDLVFANAAGEIDLHKPEREGQDGDMKYRVYRTKGKFYLDYTDSKRAYGSELAGISFRHHELGRNNMMYVADVLGMNPANKKTLLPPAPTDTAEHEQAGGKLLKQILTLFNTEHARHDTLAALLRQDKVLAPLSGWAVENAWISQDTVKQTALGDPVFVGFGKQQPSFSQVDHGILIKPDSVRVRDIFPADYFLYLAILAFMLAMLAELLDYQHENRQYWRVESLGLRVVSWPLLLVALGNLFLDHSLLHWPLQTTKNIETVYSILWWLIPARLLTHLVRRFLWDPLEMRSKRKVPDSVKSLTTFSIYLMMLFGITAFVFGQSVTSLLATTGATAMVIGLAIKNNIDNVVSGIVLNIERPFKIGDQVKLKNAMGEVLDITWRTT
ncbi:MAG: mechanosensitive ion channel, partial [Methylococcaceae bacterium]